MDHHSRRRDYRHRGSRSQSRSRSPDRSSRRDHHHRHSHRHERSHGHGHGDHRRRHHHRSSHHDKDKDKDRKDRRERATATAIATAPITLPFESRELSRRDLPVYEPMFAMYLDIQKGKWIEDMDEEEVKGRWKSFVQKWNRGELAEGWYDPSTLQKVRRSAQDQPPPPPAAVGQHRDSPDYEGGRGEQEENGVEDDDDDEEDYGPNLPQAALQSNKHGGPSSGPTIPTMQDLELRKELAIEDAAEARQESRKQRHADVHSHKSEMRQIQDEVAPRAEPGTHERRMEKRQEAAAANRAFADSRRGGSPGEAAPDEELMGSGENDLAALKKSQESEQRKKNEREIKREEIFRARAAEREERVRQYRQKEEDTIGWLKTLAKQRFG